MPGMTGLYVPLDASYDQDPKILDLDDERAELLFVRSLAYSKRHALDGAIHRRALPSFAPFQDDLPAADLALMLVDAGLWTVTDKGWRITAWLKRNPSSEEFLTPNTGRELAHKRHHVNKGIQKDGCPFCFPEESQVVAHDAVPQCDADASDAMPESVPEPKPEPSPAASQETQLPPVAHDAVTLPKLTGRDLTQATARSLLRYSNTIAAASADLSPGGLARTIRADAAADGRNATLEAWIAAGMDPDDAADKLAADGGGTGHVGTEAERAEAARRAEARLEDTAAVLADQRATVPGDAAAGMAMARSARHG